MVFLKCKDGTKSSCTMCFLDSRSTTSFPGCSVKWLEKHESYWLSNTGIIQHHCLCQSFIRCRSQELLPWVAAGEVTGEPVGASRIEFWGLQIPGPQTRRPHTSQLWGHSPASPYRCRSPSLQPPSFSLQRRKAHNCLPLLKNYPDSGSPPQMHCPGEINTRQATGAIWNFLGSSFKDKNSSQ